MMKPPPQPQSFLAVANQAFREGRCTAAMVGNVKAMQHMPELGQTISFNLALTRQKYLASRCDAKKLKVVVCCWELAHNPAGRAHTLAEIYQDFAEVEIVGSLFPCWGSEIWEPLRGTTIPLASFLVDVPNRFVDQALALVASHPADVVHLSKPRAPNILFGILYKLLWGARVILDIDEEELVFVKAKSALTLGEYLQHYDTLPTLDQLTKSDWTRLAVGLSQEFDAITVSNAAVQQRYGGNIIGHARDPRKLTPSSELRQAGRHLLGIRPEQKVILFSGTPRPHKGLLEVAHAIQSLRRKDILFVIAGSFDENYREFKAQLQNVTGVKYLFSENQPLEDLARTLAIADCCVLLQDPTHPYATFQIPAKLSDALAMRIPVITSTTPALGDPIAAGAVIASSTENLATQLASTLDQPNAAQIDAGQRYFTEHLTLAANAARLQRLLEITTSTLSPALRQFLTQLSVHSPILDALHALAEPNAPFVIPQQQARKAKPAKAAAEKIAIAVHIYYPEIWPEIAQRLKRIDHPFILDITTPPEQTTSVEQAVKHDFPAARIHITPNRGMDILPFLSLVPRWQDEGILAVCKLHTKKGDGGDIATHWRQHLLDTLIGHPDTPNQIARAFADHPRLDMVGPATLYLSGQRLMYENQPTLQQLSLALNQGPLPQTDWGFFAGTMFWARPSTLAPLAQLVTGTAATVTGNYSKDGQYEHALERAFGLLPHYRVGQIGLLHSSVSPANVPLLQLAEVHATATSQLINPSHVSQAVRQTFSSVDWAPQYSKSRQSDLISIIIPIFNQPELTAACVASIYQHTATDRFELVLVDNGSDIPTQTLLYSLVRQHNNLHLLRNNENLNFANGCNLGFAASKGAIVVFLNNDTSVTPHWLPPLVDALRRPDIAAVQPKLLYPDGTIQCIGVVFSSKSPLGYPIYAGMQPQPPWAHRSRSFQAVTGACMALRANDFAEMHGFDPVYINGQEDIDLCLRLNQHRNRPSGWVAAESIVIHHESKTPYRFKHVAHNRRTYVRRWLGRVTADDQSYYAADGFDVASYKPDSSQKLPEELQVFRAQIAPALQHHCTAKADFFAQYC